MLSRSSGPSAGTARSSPTQSEMPWPRQRARLSAARRVAGPSAGGTGLAAASAPAASSASRIAGGQPAHLPPFRRRRSSRTGSPSGASAGAVPRTGQCSRAHCSAMALLAGAGVEAGQLLDAEAGHQRSMSRCNRAEIDRVRRAAPPLLPRAADAGPDIDRAVALAEGLVRGRGRRCRCRRDATAAWAGRRRCSAHSPRRRLQPARVARRAAASTMRMGPPRQWRRGENSRRSDAGQCVNPGPRVDHPGQSSRRRPGSHEHCRAREGEGARLPFRFRVHRSH